MIKIRPCQLFCVPLGCGVVGYACRSKVRNGTKQNPIKNPYDIVSCGKLF